MPLYTSHLSASAGSEITGSLILSGSGEGYATHGTDANLALAVYGPTTLNKDGSNYDFTVKGLGNDNMLFVDASTDRVGIGTDSPEGKLHVIADSAGSVTVTGEQADGIIVENNGVASMTLLDTDGGVIYFGDADDTDIGRIGYRHGGDYANSLYFTTNNAQRMTIDSTGKVGIGVADPDTALEVFKAGTQLKLSYNASDSAAFAVDDDGDLTITPSGTAVIVAGNLTVNGTTTTVNSTTMTLDDPIITLGGDSTPSSDDNKDRGVEFKWHNGSAAKVGFFGYDDSTGCFTFIPDASNSSEVFSGAAGPACFSTLEGSTITATTAIVPDASDGATLGTAALEWSDLYLADGAVVYFGDDSDVTLAHVADIGLTLKHTATADDKPIVLTLATGEVDMEAGDVIGKLAFQAPDEGTGTDAILVSAAIQAVAEGDHSSSSNATRLEFMTGASEAAASKMTLSSAGVLDVDGGITVDNITIDGQEIDISSGDLTVDVAGDIVLDADGDHISLKFGGATGQLDITNTNSGDIVIQQKTDAKDIVFLDHDGSTEGLRILDAGAGIRTAAAGEVQTRKIAYTDGDDAITIADGGGVTFGATAAITGVLTANAGVVVDNITIDGTEIDLSSGDLTLDVAGDIVLDAGGEEVIFKDGSTNVGHVSMDSDNLSIKSLVSDKDIIFQGNDGGSGITALTLDMSAAGTATFNNGFLVGSDAQGDILYHNGTNYVRLAAGTSGRFLKTQGSGANPVWSAVSGGSADELAADDLTAGDAAVLLTTSSGNITIDAAANDSDIVFKGTDGGADTTFLTLDGSDAGTATFNHDIILANDSFIQFGGASETISGDGTDMTIAANNLTVDAAADIILDAAGGDFNFKVDGTEILRITNSSSDVIIKPIADAKDLIFQQRDGTEVARIEDNATFNVVTGKLAINGTAITSTAAELNIMDGGTSATSTTVVDADRVVMNDNGTMVQVAVTDLAAYFDDEITAMPNLTSVGTLTALTVDDVAVNGKVITMTGSSSDTATITVGTNGTLDIVTTDAAAAAANIQITADGTAELAGTTVTLDSGGAVVLDSASGVLNFQDGGSTMLSFTEGNSGDVTVKLETNGKDLVFTDNGDAVNMKILDAAAGINVPGEVQTTGIGYTDGDNAMTIADGGKVTFAAGFAVGSDAAGDILYHNGTSYVRLAKGSADQVLTMNDAANAPGWENASAGAADDISAGDGAVNITTSSGNITIDAAANNSDIIFKGTDDSSDITFMTMDGSESSILIPAAQQLQFRDTGLYIASNADGDLDIVSDGTAVDSINLESAGGITLDAGTASAGIVYEDDGTEMLRIHNSSSDVIVEAKVSDKDIIFKANDGGSSVEVFRINADDATARVAVGLTPDASDGAYLGTAALQWSDLFLADGALIKFGDDQDVTLTHVADTGLLLNSTMQLQFNDASQYINAPSATVLDINATDEVEINATLCDVNANLDVSGTYTGGGLMTTGGNIVIPNAGNIGSAGDTDAIAIASNGVVTFSQVPVLPNNTIETADIQDNAVSLAKMAGLARGKIIVGDSNGDPAALALGSDTYVLTSDGNDVVWAAAAGGANPASADGDTLGTASLEWSDLYLADGGVIYFGNDQDVTLTHVHDVGLTITNTIANTDERPVVLQLKSEEDQILSNQVIGSLEFAAGDDGGTDAAAVCAGIHAIADGAFTASVNKTRLVFTTGVSETAAASATPKMILTNEGRLKLPTDEIYIAFGADEDVTLTHVPDVGLTITNTGTGDDKPCVLQLKSKEAAVIADEVIASLEFAAGETGSGDNAQVAAGIHAIAEATFTASVNKTKLVFTTGVSETAAASATAKMILDHSGDLVLPTDGATLSFGANEEIVLQHVHDKGLTLSSSISGMPEFGLLNTNNDAAGGRLFFDKNGANAADNDVLGVIDWVGENDAGSPETIIYGAVVGTSSDVSDGSEDGMLTFNTMVGGTATDMMSIGNGKVTINGPVGSGAPAAAVLEMNTIEQTIVDGDVLGSIEFKAGSEGSGTDAILIAAAIQAEADATFAADNNTTDLVFRTAESGAATEKMRLSAKGDLTVSKGLTTGGSQTVAVNLQTSAYTVGVDDYCVAMNAGNSVVNITIPEATAAIVGRLLVLVNLGAANVGVVTSQNSQNLDGANIGANGNAKVLLPGARATIICGADDNWVTIGERLPPP